MNFNHHGHTSQYLTVLSSAATIKCSPLLKCRLIPKVMFSKCDGKEWTVV